MRESTPRDSYGFDKWSRDAVAFLHTLLEGSKRFEPSSAEEPWLVFPIRAFLLPRSLFFNNADCVNDGAVLYAAVLTDPAVHLKRMPAPIYFADVAQLAEQLSCKQQVVRSVLTISTKHRRGNHRRDTLAVTQSPPGLCRFDSCPLHQHCTGSSEVERSVEVRRVDGSKPSRCTNGM